MKIELDKGEIIKFEDFSLNWRWDSAHNSNMSDKEKAQIMPLSETESKKLYKVIDYFESESYLREYFESSEYFMANSETVEASEKFSNKFRKLSEKYDENLFISWNRRTCIYTTKEIFLKYWDDFCYPTSDDITIISELTNWVYFYKHIEVGIFWSRKE